MSTNSMAFLYDAPGPMTVRRTRIFSVLSVLVLVTITGFGLLQLSDHGQLAATRWLPLFDPKILAFLGGGLAGTLAAAALVTVMAFPLGVALASARVSPRRWVSRAAAAFIETFRTLPVLLLIYVMLFALPKYGINPDVVWKLALPLTISNSAAIAEIVRAGILSLPKGQTEAGLSLGMTGWQVMRKVRLPQALRSVTPSLVSQLVSLLKDTSLGYVVAFTEMLYRAQILTSYNRLLIQTYVVVALIYLIVCGLLSALATWLRRRVDRPVRAAAPVACPTQSSELQERGN